MVIGLLEMLTRELKLKEQTDKTDKTDKALIYKPAYIPLLKIGEIQTIQIARETHFYNSQRYLKPT